MSDSPQHGDVGVSEARWVAVAWVGGELAAVGPASWLWWRDDLRATVNGLSVSWLRAQRP